MFNKKLKEEVNHSKSLLIGSEIIYEADQTCPRICVATVRDNTLPKHEKVKN